MADQTPLRYVVDGSGNPTALHEFATGETVAVEHGGTGATTAANARTNLGAAPLNSPALTGTPTAPTPAAGDDSTRLATTAFVTAAAALPSNATPLMDGTATAGNDATLARGDHRHPTDTSRAPLNSPTFTGTPDAPTPPTGDDSTRLATTAFVQDALSVIRLPAAALPYPTIATTGNKLTVTALSVGGQGGQVTIAAGKTLILCVKIGDELEGRQVAMKTAAWTSPILATNATYYLRATIVDGALLLYCQKGSDNDLTPATLVGTPNETSGGGFDSTVFDVLLAKITTTYGGQLPTVIALANASVLHKVEETNVGASSVTWLDTPAFQAFYTKTMTLNWARTPTDVMAVGEVGSSIVNTGVLMQGVVNAMTITASSRYVVSAKCLTDWSGRPTADLAQLYASVRVLARA